MAEIRKVGVLGCGLMGHGITQIAAQAGYEVASGKRGVLGGPLDPRADRVRVGLA